MEQENKGRMVDLFLPDTNVLIYAFKGIEPYAGWISGKIKTNSLVISSVVAAEYLSGASENEELSLKLLADKTNILPVDLVVAEVGAKYKKTFSQKTKKVWLSDCLIAATCKVYGATLVTDNVQDYPMKDIKTIHINS